MFWRQQVEQTLGHEFATSHQDRDRLLGQWRQFDPPQHLIQARPQSLGRCVGRISSSRAVDFDESSQMFGRLSSDRIDRILHEIGRNQR